MGEALVAGDREADLLDLAQGEGVELRRLLVSGTASELRPTEVAQPALFYTGVALSGLLLEAGLEPAVAAGHSLGEFCALTAAGALGAEDGMRLVLARGRLMAQAPPGTMAAVLGMEVEQLEPICRQVDAAGEACVIANDNSPGQLVVSGTAAGVALLAELAPAAGARRVVPLQVGGAFHSPLMAEAAATFAALVDQVAVRAPRFPIATGVEGALVRDSAQVRVGLRRQLDSPVRWRQAVAAMVGLGVRTFVECGPGNTLAGLMRRIEPEARTLSLSQPQGVSELLGALRPEALRS